MPLHAKIPATIITGFLGAGKTSLIRHLLDQANGRKLALIINEFGDLGVDRDIVNGCGIEGCAEDDVVELTNGCICCTVADDFLPAIQGLLERETPPDHIVIETSGLALPKPLVKAFGWPDVRTRVTVDGVIAVIDARAVADGLFATDPELLQKQREEDPGLDHESPLEELFEEQLGCADLVVMNKLDLLAPTDKAGVQDTMRRHLRPEVKIVEATRSEVDPAVILGLDAAAEDDLDSRHSHHDDHHGAEDHHHDDFESFVLELPEISDPAGLEKSILAAIAEHNILRVKGFLDIKGKPMRQVLQGVGSRIERYFDRPWSAEESRQSRLVIIGETGLDQTAIRSRILQHPAL